MIHVSIEFSGAARNIVGQKQISLELDEKSSFRDIISLLGKRYPGLIGILIDAGGKDFLSSNMFVINGDMTTPAMVIDESPHDGDHLVLMSLITGG
jgi:hypothetical protein